MIAFGRIEPKERPWMEKYSFSRLGLKTVETVEASILTPIWHYEQIGSSCTAYSIVDMQMLYNLTRTGNHQICRWIKYDGMWQYKQICDYDNDPLTTVEADLGSYTWASFWTVQHLGCKRIKESQPRLGDGIDHYYWIQTVDEIRTAFSLGRIPIMGTNWTTNMLTPFKHNREWWITISGPVEGGHQYKLVKSSDKRQACRIRNTWGEEWPDSWISYENIARLLQDGGECGVAIDRIPAA